MIVSFCLLLSLVTLGDDNGDDEIFTENSSIEENKETGIVFFCHIYTHFKNSLVIHEGNTKQISTMTVTFIYEVGSWTYTGVVLDDMVV